MRLYTISESSVSLLYRSDERINDDPDHYLRLIKSGRYNGRYYTSSVHDAAIYYPAKEGPGQYSGYLLVVRIVDDLVTDGHLTDVALLDEYTPDVLLSLRDAGVPDEIISKFEQLALGESEDDSIAHYSGTTSTEKFELLKMIFRYTGSNHLRDHGQVALLGRNLRADEFVDLKPYKIVNGNIVFQDESVPVKDAYRSQFGT